MQGVATERKRRRGVEGWSGGWEGIGRGRMGDGGEKYCCVLLESGGYHGDEGERRWDARTTD